MSQMRRGYKIRYYTSGKGKDGVEYKNYSLTVPSEVAEALPKGMQFLPRMVDEAIYDSEGNQIGSLQGLLFEPIESAQIELPNWAKQQNGGGKEDQAEAA